MSLDFKTFYNIIDGQQRGSDSIHNGINPTSGEKLWDVPVGSEQDLNDAVAAAKKAFPAWRDTPIEKRKELVKQMIALSQRDLPYIVLTVDPIPDSQIVSWLKPSWVDPQIRRDINKLIRLRDKMGVGQ